MNYYVYEITNNINNKKYIGKRKCKCNIEDDKYMGSGKYLWNAINKYGIENFSKEIIYIAESEKEALDYEKYIIEHYYCILTKIIIYQLVELVVIVLLDILKMI